MRRHPDEASSAFHLKDGWCVCCDAVLRNVGEQRWYGEGGAGPYCSLICLRGSTHQGTLPDYVHEGAATSFKIERIELTPDGTHTITGTDVRTGNVLVLEGCVPTGDGSPPSFPDCVRVPFDADLSLGDNWHGDEAR